MDLARVTKLGDTNYETWAFSVKALLRRLKLWKYVEPGTPPAAPSAEWSTGDEDALTTIQLVVEESQQSVIRDKVTAKATWEALKERHSKLRLGQMIIIQIATQNYQDGDSIETYLSSIEKLYARLDNAGVRMQECIKVGLILRGLPPSYRPLIMVLEARDEEDLTLAMVKAKLLDEANNFQHQQARGQAEQALKVKTRPKVLVRYRCGKAGHRKADCDESDDEGSKKFSKKKPKEKAKQVLYRGQYGATSVSGCRGKTIQGDPRHRAQRRLRPHDANTRWV